MLQDRKMPTKLAIAKHWAQKLADMGRFDSCFEAIDSARENWCWNCGFGVGRSVHRCHIKARANGGADSVDNLHLLCPLCHKYSEYLEGDDYWEWFNGEGLPTKEWLAFLADSNPPMFGKIIQEHLPFAMS